MSHLNNELYEIVSNHLDWEKRYLHVNYTQTLDMINAPCPGVFWFPVATERFCDELDAEMNHCGKWSDGSNTDSRVQGGYENVPTRDIHMKQIGWEDGYQAFLKNYIQPVQMRVFKGYDKQPTANTNFVVRYKLEEQPSLKTHFDGSTYTINMALNKAGLDYQGGGCHFIRYNCSVTDTRKGRAMMHPGRLTHFHEGLTTTKGTRYIMVSFVDP